MSDAQSNEQQFWRVEVSDHDGQIVAIEPNMLAGRDIGDRERIAIEFAIANLRGFIGRDEWQEIHTAPKDGSGIWLFSPTHGVVEGSWEQVDGGGHPENGPPIYWWVSPHVEFIDGPYDAPTHWMPLPDAPLTALDRSTP